MIQVLNFTQQENRGAILLRDKDKDEDEHGDKMDDEMDDKIDDEIDDKMEHDTAF